MHWHLGGCLADSGETTPPGFSQFLVDKGVASKSIFQIHPSHPLYQAATLRPGSACPNHPWARYQTTGHSCYVLNMLKLLTTLNLLTPPHLFLLEQTVMKPLPTVLPRPVSCRRLPVWILLAWHVPSTPELWVTSYLLKLYLSPDLLVLRYLKISMNALFSKTASIKHTVSTLHGVHFELF